MIRVQPTDLLQIKSEGSSNRYFYTVVLGGPVLFGGNLSFAFSRIYESPQSPESLLSKSPVGFHTFVDYLQANKENRIKRIGKVSELSKFNNFKGFKNAIQPPSGKPKHWYIYNTNGKVLKRVRLMTNSRKQLPNYECIDETTLSHRLITGWRPELDSRL